MPYVENRKTWKGRWPEDRSLYIGCPPHVARTESQRGAMDGTALGNHKHKNLEGCKDTMARAIASQCEQYQAVCEELQKYSKAIKDCIEEEIRKNKELRQVLSEYGKDS